MGWTQDLSAKDPWFVLPLIMAGATFVRTTRALTPRLDPGQGDTILPVVMSVTLAFLTAGLVRYWMMNTVLSTLQQLSINRRIEAEGRRARAVGKKFSI
jgi:YidC/Oxa1 family membrane protein insertase